MEHMLLYYAQELIFYETGLALGKKKNSIYMKYLMIFIQLWGIWQMIDYIHSQLCPS